MRQKGKIEQMLQKAREYRLHCYRRMLLIDMADEADRNDDTNYSVQDYHEERIEASENAARLLDYIDLHKNKLSSEEQSELLLTAFVAQNVGFYDYAISIRAVEMAELFIPTLPDSQTKFHLLVYLYHETEDDSIRKEIEGLMVMADSEEDRYLLNLYLQMSEQCFA